MATSRRQAGPGPQQRDNRMPNAGVKATNIAPRFNNNAGSQMIGANRITKPGPLQTDVNKFGGPIGSGRPGGGPKIDPGFNRINPRRDWPGGPSPGGMPGQGIPGTPQNSGQDKPMGALGRRTTPNQGAPPKNFDNWSQQRQDRFGRQNDHGNNDAIGPPDQQTPGFDWNAFNAWQDPNIGGDQSGLTIQPGWGGFSSLTSHDAQGNSTHTGTQSMLATKMNGYLNTLPTGGAREQAMNAMGYNNGGNPYTPNLSRSDNRFYRQNAQNNAQTGDYSAPGTYQHQDAAGNYTGYTTVGANGAAQYTSFDPSGPRNAGNGGNNQGGHNGGNGGPGGNGGQGGGQGGHNGGGGGGNGGGNGGNNGQRPGYPGTGTPGSMGNYANFPEPGTPAENFLPMTPQFEAGRRGLADEQQNQQQQILAQQAMIDPQYQQGLSRMATDQQFQTDRMKEQLAGRGVYTPYGASGALGSQPVAAQNNAGGGIGQYMFNRDIQIPYGRQRSDMATNAANQYGSLNNAYGDTELAYNQGMAELLLNRASDAAQMMPMNVPQYSTGGRNIRGQQYTNPYNAPPNPNNQNNRNRNRRGRNHGK